MSYGVQIHGHLRRQIIRRRVLDDGGSPHRNEIGRLAQRPCRPNDSKLFRRRVPIQISSLSDKGPKPSDHNVNNTYFYVNSASNILIRAQAGPT